MQLLHTRKTQIDCWLTDDGRYQAEGIIDDDKGVRMLTYSGKEIQPGGDLHTMRVVLLVNRSLIIEHAEIEMIDVPGDECMGACASPESLVGLSVTRGYTSGLKERIGGTKGCAHVFALLQQMGAAITQGAFTDPQNREHDQLQSWQPLINTCHTWREDGPIVTERRQQTITTHNKEP
ncbi:MAG: DUF2889 domain-containing protein [Gammaproteobacteria bacterium]|nr:DUF2889 domain-containing protein [Gammaproteobacteria bacterium]